MTDFSPAVHARMRAFLERDHDRVSPAGRTKLLVHSGPRPVVVVLLHGLSASPTQFVRFAVELHERGHNVIVPRLPRHGHEDRLSDALARLTMDDLRAIANETIELANELGERVVVAGFSLGGLLSAWVAQQHPVHRVVAIAPFLGVSWIPNRWMARASEVMLWLPNLFPWWNPLKREKLQPEHGYPRFATHAIGHMYRLARHVFDDAVRPPRANEVIFVTNAREAAVNNRAVFQLIERLRRHEGARVSHVELLGLPFSHDIIEPLHNPAIADRVYPQLLAIIEGEPV